jgi:ribosomal protein S18 acetylase RimI-like enzyme
MPLSIRPVADGDETRVAELWRDCNLVVAYNDPLADIRLCRSTPTARLFVGEVDGRIVATAMAGSEGHRGWLYYVAVDPKLRRAGHARAMVSHAEAWLASQGAPKVQLLIREANVPVRDVYARFGYTVEPRLVMSRWLKGGPPPPPPFETVVTYLEMFRRPTHAPPPTPALKLALMRTERPTVSFYRYLYNTVGAAWTWSDRRYLGDDELAAIVHHPKIEISVLNVGGVPAGYFELDRRRSGDVELAYFGLIPEFIGRGLGWYLLNVAVDAAWTAPPKTEPVRRVWVHTCDRDHPRALSLYQRAGFEAYKQQTEATRDPRLVGLPWPKSAAAGGKAAG